jgi:hypothetical protein
MRLEILGTDLFPIMKPIKVSITSAREQFGVLDYTQHSGRESVPRAVADSTEHD